jgi:hypothetical protein
VFGAVVLGVAPGRIVAMARRLYRALMGKVIA